MRFAVQVGDDQPQRHLADRGLARRALQDGYVEPGATTEASSSRPSVANRRASGVDVVVGIGGGGHRRLVVDTSR